LLAEKPAVQLRSQPLMTVQPLITAGHACITRRYTEWRNGKEWDIEEVSITDAGREYLQNSTDR